MFIPIKIAEVVLITIIDILSIIVTIIENKHSASPDTYRNRNFVLMISPDTCSILLIPLI